MRPRLFTDDEAKAVLTRLATRLHRKPTVAEYADYAGVSTRTAFRYFRKVSEHATCPKCQGTGWIRKAR